MIESYKSIGGASEGSYKDRGSRFLAFAFPVHEAEEIREHLDRLRKQYHDARHHCYAWRLGPDAGRYRANDDGEPSGTAGKPILGQLQSFDLTDILVVVVRYFGGTKLGVSGLIQAYRGAAAEALGASRIEEHRVSRRIRLEFPYELMNPVMKVAKDHELDFLAQDFQMDCSLELGVWVRVEKAVLDAYKKIHGCKTSILE